MGNDQAVIPTLIGSPDPGEHALLPGALHRVFPGYFTGHSARPLPRIARGPGERSELPGGTGGTPRASTSGVGAPGRESVLPDETPGTSGASHAPPSGEGGRRGGDAGPPRRGRRRSEQRNLPVEDRVLDAEQLHLRTEPPVRRAAQADRDHADAH